MNDKNLERAAAFVAGVAIFYSVFFAAVLVWLLIELGLWIGRL